MCIQFNNTFVFRLSWCCSTGSAFDPVHYGVDFGHKHGFGAWSTVIPGWVRVDEVSVVHPIQSEGVADVALKNLRRLRNSCPNLNKLKMVSILTGYILLKLPTCKIGKTAFLQDIWKMRDFSFCVLYKYVPSYRLNK